MTEDELRERLEQDLGLLRQPAIGGFSIAEYMRMHLESVLLLEASNRNLASSSERLDKRNLWLTIAVLIVGVLQLIAVFLQLWLATAHSTRGRRTTATVGCTWVPERHAISSRQFLQDSHQRQSLKC